MKQQMRCAKSHQEPSIDFVLVTKEGTRHVDQMANISIDSLEGCFPYEQDSLEMEAAPLDNMSPDSLDDEIVLEKENQRYEPIVKRTPTAWTVEWDPPRGRKPKEAQVPRVQHRHLSQDEIRFNDENFKAPRTAPKLLLNTLATRGGVTVFNTNRHNSSLRFN
jgi:hypothetical protein